MSSSSTSPPSNDAAFSIVDYRGASKTAVSVEVPKGPKGLPKRWRLSSGFSVSETWPDDAVVDGKISQGEQVGDIIGCDDHLLVISERIRPVLEGACPGCEVEFLPAQLRVQPQGPTQPIYFVNPVGTFDALEPLASGAELDETGRIMSIDEVVLDREKAKSAPPIFRLEGKRSALILRAEVVDALEAAGAGNLVVHAVKVVEPPALSPKELERAFALRNARKVGMVVAAREGTMETLNLLIEAASPAEIDGEDGEVWHGEAKGCIDGAPYKRPLDEAARCGRDDAVAALLAAGASVNALNYRGESALHQAVSENARRCVELLLDAGASMEAAGCKGSVVTCAGTNLEMLTFLLDRGADPSVADPWGQTAADHLQLENQTAGCGGASVNLGSRLRALGRLLERWPTSDPRLPEYRGALRALRAENGAIEQQEAAAAEAFEALITPEALASTDWASRIQGLLGDDLRENRDQVDALCEKVLCAPEAVAQPAWGEMIKALVELTVDYGDLTEDAYFERLSPGDEDEGGVLEMMSDERLTTVEDALTLLALPFAIARGDWADLVRHVFETKVERVGSMGFGGDEAVALFESSNVEDHPERSALLTAARAAFPGSGL